MDDIMNRMRNLVIGDIHSSYDRLQNVLAKAGFDKDNDNLYSTGDLCDRGEKPVETLFFLMSLPHFFPVAGNHDLWLYDAIVANNPDDWWIDHNGGLKTWQKVVCDKDRTFVKKVRSWIGDFPFIRILPDYIIVHGGLAGITNERELERYTYLTVSNTYVPQDSFGNIVMLRDVELLAWDRDYVYQALGVRKKWKTPIPPLDTKKTIICGHTPLRNTFHSEEYHLTCLDTGSFVEDGHISVMDLDTCQIWQSD